MLENQEMQDELTLAKEGQTKSAATNNSRFAVHAPYWLNGLHNLEGLELADEINKQVQASMLTEKEDAIKQLLLAYPTAKQLGLNVVDEQIYLGDGWRKRNLAQPKDLMGACLFATRMVRTVLLVAVGQC